ncbi:hypothetical protein LTR70_001531 [Exophiala xenobiotica]|uniref:Uncharacterized protein n=1 Tax=Lithohypha guttulata TaxID=1690604 RepID=A0ABR0K7F9_9EURO|nr:hypothetical protein LTR24_005948 [Lithohypha guttulata]KAK5327908.1 hypothetical protein LTR70_001531 [Exophiala xenobiotica]
MSKQEPQWTGATATPPPHYFTPVMDGRLPPQHTGSSRTPYEYELDDMRRERPLPSQGYNDEYYRWRRGVENEMPHRPPNRSKAAHVFATCCCGSPWGFSAWVIGLILVIGATTALLVKALHVHKHCDDLHLFDLIACSFDENYLHKF